MLERVGLIRHDAHVDDLAIQSREHSIQRVAVAVVDLARAERLANRAELVAGRKERDAELAIDRDFDDAERREHPELRRANGLTGAKHRRTTLEILARKTPIRPGLHDRAFGDRHAARKLGGALLHHDGVGTGRHHTASENAHRFIRTEGPGEWRARKRLADALQFRFAFGVQIGETHSPSVHRGVVVAGHVVRRHDVLGEHPIQCKADVNALDGGHRLQELPDQLACLLDAHRIRVVIIGAGELAQRLGSIHGGLQTAISGTAILVPGPDVRARARRVLPRQAPTEALRRRVREVPNRLPVARASAAAGTNTHKARTSNRRRG